MVTQLDVFKEMNMEDLKIGDVVHLKSGGPEMTIADIRDYSSSRDGAFCEWFDGKEKKSAVFSLRTLEKYKVSI